MKIRAILATFVTVIVAAAVTIVAFTNADAASHPRVVRLGCLPRNGPDACLKTDTRPMIGGLFGATPSAPNPGNTFTSSTGTWTNTPTSYHYQWEDCDGSGNNCVSIIGATSASYTVQSSDLGFTLAVVVTGCNSVGCSLPSPASTSSPTGLVAAAGTAPTNASAPKITGTPKSGSTLTASTGTWSGSPTSYTYQWQDCNSAGTSCTNVSTGGTASTYTVGSGDLNSTLRVGVTATNANGSSPIVYSTTTPLVGSNTLGYTTVGANCAGVSSNVKRVQSYTLSTAATLTSFSIYMGTTGNVGSQPVAGVIYADSGGSPSTRLATSSTITITQSSAAQWYTASFPATTLAAGTYWIGYISGSTGQIATGCWDTAGSNVRDINSDTFSDGPTDPFGTVTSTDAHIMSDYVSYTPSGSGSSTPTQPTNLSASPSSTQVSLSWTASTESGGTITGYKVFRDGTQVGTSTLTSYTDTGLANGIKRCYYVAAYDASGNVSASSSQACATPASSTGATVPAAPEGVTMPAGGWTVEYADAFGSCFTDPLTTCSAGYARSDNTMEGIQQANGFGNPNEVGVAALEPSEINVTNQGLDLLCNQTANLGDVFSCGSSRGLNTRGYATNPFNWSFTANRHYVLQYSWQLPDNVAHMMDPAVWETGVSWAWEIDNPECWGYGFGADSTADHGWYGKSCGGIAVPKDPGGGTGNLQYTIGTTPNVPADPTAAMHTDTIDFVDDSSGTLTATFYIDGVKIGSHSYSTFSSSIGKLILASGMRLNKACACITSNFPSGGTHMLIRYIAMYEPATAANAGTNGPIVVPGTTIQ